MRTRHHFLQRRLATFVLKVKRCSSFAAAGEAIQVQATDRLGDCEVVEVIP